MAGAAPLDALLVLAGGAGTRLWPWSGPRLPKPLLPLGGGGRTLLAATLDRAGRLAPEHAIRLLAPEALASRLREAGLAIPAEAIWTEPAPRDTGPAIALAMRRLLDEGREAVVAVLPADHRVEDESAFDEAIARAAEAARDGALVLLGVVPDRPETGFGYVEPERKAGAAGTAPVRRFVEKPDRATARRLVAEGCLWNAGIFVWQAGAFWAALERHAPELAEAVDRYHRSGRPEAWERAPRLSIDYALMERASGCRVVPLDAGWSDVGGWEAVLDLAARGEAGPAISVAMAGEEGGSVLVWIDPSPPPPRAIALGAEPLLVVRGPHGLLATPRQAAGRIKRLI